MYDDTEELFDIYAPLWVWVLAGLFLLVGAVTSLHFALRLVVYVALQIGG